MSIGKLWERTGERLMGVEVPEKEGLEMDWEYLTMEEHIPKRALEWYP